MYHAASMHIIYTNHLCMLYNDYPGRPSEMRQRRPISDRPITTHATTQPVAGPAPRRDSSAIVILTPHLE